MEEFMICPVCGQQHKLGTTYCPVFLAPIPVAKPKADRENDTNDEQCQNCENSDITKQQKASCPNCGYVGHAGEVCAQCGTAIPTPNSVSLKLPDGQEIAIIAGGEILIGRESTQKDVAKALEKYEGVSRKHCLLRIDSQGKCATIMDLGSTNGTWVGKEKNLIPTDGFVTSALPIEVHLGNKATIYLEKDDNNE